MKNIGRNLSLAVIIVAVGFMLQCGSDPALIGDGGLVDVWLADMGFGDDAGSCKDVRTSDFRFGQDGIGPKADAAETPETPTEEWFTLAHKRGEEDPDDLAEMGSDVSVYAGYVFDNGTLRFAPANVTITVYDVTRRSRLYLNVVLHGVVSPMTAKIGEQITYASLTESDAKAILDETNTFSCSWLASLSSKCQLSGAINFSIVRQDIVKGTYELAFSDENGKDVTLQGEFQAVPVTVEFSNRVPQDLRK